MKCNKCDCKRKNEILSFAMEPFLYHQRAIQKFVKENNDFKAQSEIKIIQLKSELEMYKQKDRELEVYFDMEETFVPDENEQEDLKELNFEEETSRNIRR